MSPVIPSPRPEHNHVTRDIKSKGKCPACDLYWHNAATSPEEPRQAPA